jgi:hypothetical protein
VTPTATATATATAKSPALAASLRDAELGASPSTEEDDASEVDCFRFYYGTGVPEDAARARGCFERNVGKASCDASSPDLQRLYLATMRLDAQGGPRDAEGARALLKDCFADVSVSGVLGARRTKGPIDFCRDIGGTTLSMQECALVNDARATFEQQRAVKGLFASLDDAGKARYRVASDAFARYAELDATRAGDAYRGGSLRPQTELQHRTRLATRRTKQLTTFLTTPPTAPDLPQLEAKLATLRAHLRRGLDAEGAAAFDAAEAAWESYRDAELAFYKQSGDGVRAALVRDRIEALKP